MKSYGIGVLVMGLLACGAASNVARGDVIFQTGVPGENSTRADPFTLRIDNGAGVFTPVNVIDIIGGGGPGADDADDKAARIRRAIITQAPVFGATGIKNVVRINRTTHVQITRDPTKEKFDKLGVGIDYQAKLRADLGSSPSGLDPFGMSSVVEAGIDNVYIATVLPTDGEPLSILFDQLASDLTRHGISASYEPSTGTLSLSDVLSPSELFAFGNTDTGLSTSAEVTGVVPEPSTLILLTAGLLLLAVAGVVRRRGEHRIAHSGAC
jgi:hypothetical protein